MNCLKVFRLVFCLAGITMSVTAGGCGGPVAETDKPISAEEQSELNDQLSTIEEQGAR